MVMERRWDGGGRGQNGGAQNELKNKLFDFDCS